MKAVLFCLIFLTLAGAEASARGLKSRAEDVITIDRDAGGDTAKLQKSFARIAPRELESAKLKTYDTRTLELLFEAVFTAEDQLERPDLIAPLENIFKECSGRGFIGTMNDDLFMIYIRTRELAKARALADRFASKSMFLPKIIEPDPPAKDVPGIFVVSSDGKTLTYKPVDLSPPTIVSVVNPECHFAQGMKKIIDSDPHLADAYNKYAINIDPAAYSLETDEWTQLNAQGGIQYNVLYRASGWKGFDFRGVPRFYFVKDGKILSQIPWALPPAEFKAKFLEGVSQLEAPKP